LKQYRCIFGFGRGHTTIRIRAYGAAAALSEAQLTVRGDADTVEVWDETGLVLERDLRSASALNSLAQPPPKA
jgi:hypothetical protein